MAFDVLEMFALSFGYPVLQLFDDDLHNNGLLSLLWWS